MECKYKSKFSKRQYERQRLTGETLARRLGKALHFGLVCREDRDPAKATIDEPYVTWGQVEAKLAEM